jgi:CRP/FNR family cyclic AMP-dependent transcriptional regulator
LLIDLFKKIIQDPEFPENQAWRWRKFSDQELVIRAGDTDRKIFLVKTGNLRVTGRVELEDGKHVQPGLNDLGPGDLFGEVTLFGKKPRTASVTALSEVELLEIDCARLIEYTDQHRDIGYELIKSIFQILVERFGKACVRVEYFVGWGLKAHGIDKHL